MPDKPSYEELEKRVSQLEDQSEELQHSQEALQRSEMLFRDLVEKLPFPIALGTADLQTVYMNPRFTEIFGYSAEDIPDQKAWRQKLMPDNGYRAEKSREVDQWITSKDRSKIFFRRFTDKSGQLHDVLVHTIQLENRYYNVLEDVTKRMQAEKKLRQAYDILEQRVEERTNDLTRINLQLQAEIRDRQLAEAALRRSEEKYRFLVENANDAIFVTQDGRIKFANPSASRMTGYRIEELTNVPFAEIIHIEDRSKIMDIHFRRLRGENVVKNYTFRVLSKTGGELWQQINSVSITWQGRSATLSFIRDITQQKRLESQLIQSQKMEAIGTLAGGIAHDFNNLMMTIQGNVSLMLFDVPSSHPNHQNLVNIEKQIERGARLTSQLLGFAKKGKYQVLPINLNEIVAETAEAFGRTKKEISIQLKLAEDLLLTEVDRGQIEQTLLNLYLNAADAMPRGGKLIIKTVNVTHNAIKAKLYEPNQGRYVSLSVSDSGEGMEKGTLERMFDPFFTTKEMGSGSGLGLASVYGIIKSHNGYIEVESAKNCGTTFQIFLPAVEKKAARPDADFGTIVEGCGTILLVDDEDMILEIGVQLLERLGYQVIRANSGIQALRIFEKNKDLIDLVIVDVIMPEMGGGEVFDKLREIKADANVLLSSGYSLNGEAREILNRGCSGFIQKPFTLKQLSHKIKASLPAPGNKARK